jgi:hypothetical protein
MTTYTLSLPSAFFSALRLVQTPPGLETPFAKCPANQVSKSSPDATFSALLEIIFSRWRVRGPALDDAELQEGANVVEEQAETTNPRNHRSMRQKARIPALAVPQAYNLAE